MAQELGNGRRRGELIDGGCAWRAQMVPRGAVLGKPGAHEVVWAWGSAPVRPGGRRRRTASPVDEVQGERRWKKLAVAVL